MGYYEVKPAAHPSQHNKRLIIYFSPQVPCQLCGVPFRIGRFRTQFESRAAAWSPDSTYDPAIEDEGNCAENGCKLVFRHTNPDNPSATEASEERLLDEFVDVAPSGVDSECNEVSFDAYTKIRFQEPGRCNFGRSSNWQTYCSAYWAYYKSKVPDGPKNPYTRPPGEERPFCEHVAGVDCLHGHGFNGNAISADEMRLCNTAQYIVEKDSRMHHLPEWTPASDDEDFERESRYFLSGLADKPAGLEGDCTTHPERHGLHGDDMSPNEYDGFYNGDLIFHPHCLETYKRVSALRLDSAELTRIPEFADWWTSDGMVNPPPAHKSVGCGQWYEHDPGSEFVVANPLQIPALTAIFEAARRPHDFDAKERSPFGVKGTVGMNNSSDIFGKLPGELHDMFLTSLGSKDIANLRLASRTFRHLPITLWRELITKELPWIWEACSDRPYPYMSCITRPELEAHDQAMKDRTQATQRLGDEEKMEQMEMIARDDATFRESRAVHQLSRSGTDWYYLYCRLSREWKDIKGLQNRERIWKTIEYIVRRIAHPDEDSKFATKAHEKAFPFRDP
jgi:hypothetical protein